MAGTHAFIFEPVEPQGGSWLGVVAVVDDDAATSLAASQSAWEIPEAKYQELKKKAAGQATSQGFVPSQTPQLPALPLQQPSARPAGATSHSEFQGGSGDSAAGSVAASAPVPVANTTLKTTSAKPPAEPLIDFNPRDKRTKKAA